MSNYSGKQILVIDDDAMNREVMEAFLETEDYVVLLANNGETGLEEAVSQQPDLILLDVRMPDMSGYEVCEKLKADPRTESIPVIMVSGLDREEDKKRARDAGAAGFLPRPFSIDEFLKTVDAIISPSSN